MVVSLSGDSADLEIGDSEDTGIALDDQSEEGAEELALDSDDIAQKKWRIFL